MINWLENFFRFFCTFCFPKNRTWKWLRKGAFFATLSDLFRGIEIWEMSRQASKSRLAIYPIRRLLTNSTLFAVVKMFLANLIMYTLNSFDIPFCYLLSLSHFLNNYVWPVTNAKKQTLGLVLPFKISSLTKIWALIFHPRAHPRFTHPKSFSNHIRCVSLALHFKLIQNKAPNVDGIQKKNFFFWFASVLFKAHLHTLFLFL